MCIEGPGIAVLILAHNESGAIESTVISVVKDLSPQDALFVVADNCSDETAANASQAGARVFIRSTGGADGKAKALTWFLQKHASSLDGYRMLVILDADSKIMPGFMQAIKAALSEESKALQCFVYPLHPDKAPIGRLAALSELLDQYLSDKIRSRLGWPVRLRGTGMVLRPDIAIRVCDKLQTEVEDIALTLLLASEGINIGRIEAALVYDQKPGTTAAATQQRARWYRGQWIAMWVYRKEIARTLLLGPKGWSLLGSLFLRPKWLIVVISFLLALLLVPWPYLALPFGIYVVFSLVYLAWGLARIPERRIYIRALLYSPAYIWMWLHSILLALRPSRWRRARD